MLSRTESRCLGGNRSWRVTSMEISRTTLVVFTLNASRPNGLAHPSNFDQYDAMHQQKVLQNKMAELKVAISDQNLELLPDYESRIEVLKDLRFIDHNATVLLKGRVACEVRYLRSFIIFTLQWGFKPCPYFRSRSTLLMNSSSRSLYWRTLCK